MMKYSDEFVSGAHAHAVGAVNLRSLVSGSLPIDDDSGFEVMLLIDGDHNCSILVMTGTAELVRSVSFEWNSNRDTTERVFQLCDYIAPSHWAQMDAEGACQWNLTELDPEVIVKILAEGYSENREDFDSSAWRKNWHPRGGRP